jgi:hypothetical protein
LDDPGLGLLPRKNVTGRVIEPGEVDWKVKKSGD